MPTSRFTLTTGIAFCGIGAVPFFRNPGEGQKLLNRHSYQLRKLSPQVSRTKICSYSEDFFSLQPSRVIT
jgi:hypothetical protein